MISLPGANGWHVDQASDIYGTVSASKALDFNKKGYIQAANKANTLTSSSNTATFGLPIACVTDGTYHYMPLNNAFAVYNFSVLPSPAVIYGSGGSVPVFGYYSDSVMYQSLCTISGQTKVVTYSGGTSGTWTDRITGLSVNYPHPMCVMENRQTLLVGNGNVVNQYSSSYVLDSTNQLTLPPEYVVTWIRYRQSTALIGTRNIMGREAKVFLWNAVGTAFQTAYGVGSDWAYSGAEYQSSIVVMSSSGRLLRFNGSGFDELAVLPVWISPYSWSSNAAQASLIGKVANRGMDVHGDLLYVNLDGTLSINANENPGSYLPTQPSGLWVYDPSAGFYHRAGVSGDPMLSLTPTDVASKNLVFATAHQATTGDPVMYGFAGALGLNVGQTYYAVVEGTFATGLALTPADALAGRKVNITGTPTTDAFLFQNHTQEGASSVSSPGFVFPLGTPHLNNFYASEILYSATAKDSTNTDQGVLMSIGSGRTRGYVVTPKVYSGQVEDTMQKIYAKFDPLYLATDQVVVKARSTARFGLPTALCTGTWTSSTTFTVDTNTQDFKNVIVGDEIEVISGANAGYLAHVTAINSTSTTYIVTIDETMPTASGGFSFIADNWTKRDTVASSTKNNIDNFAEVGVMQTSTWAQFKLELRGNVTINQLQLVNTNHKKSA